MRVEAGFVGRGERSQVEMVVEEHFFCTAVVDGWLFVVGSKVRQSEVKYQRSVARIKGPGFKATQSRLAPRKSSLVWVRVLWPDVNSATMPRLAATPPPLVPERKGKKKEEIDRVHPTENRTSEQEDETCNTYWIEHMGLIVWNNEEKDDTFHSRPYTLVPSIQASIRAVGFILDVSIQNVEISRLGT